MAFVIKTRPFDGEAGQEVRLQERALYGGQEIAAGGEVFIWFSERQGGSGLAWRAPVISSETANDRTVAVIARLIENAPEAALGIEELAPLRDSGGNDGLSGLSRKLYRQAHNKCAALSATEVSVLRNAFNTSSS